MQLVVGIVWAFTALGVGWSKIQWLAAALTFGLGFGLQEIVANFVSGLIILFERPVRVGDTVTVGDLTGTVSRVHIRATTITDWDNLEIIVPNGWTDWMESIRVISESAQAVGIDWTTDIAVARGLIGERVALQGNMDPSMLSLWRNR